LPPERLEIEITESVLLERANENYAFMERLKGIGVSLALDDFGTGYSSLSCLTTFPFDKIKIDKSFIRDLSEREDCLAIVQSVIGLGACLGMETTAEGIETPLQLQRVRALGAEAGQGYLFSKPLSVADVETMLARQASAADTMRRAG